jgi:hypothetical protein
VYTTRTVLRVKEHLRMRDTAAGLATTRQTEPL